jgi:BlaR1 peptidase M56
MHPILLYLLKMLLCSGILYGYYRVALYNERFHQWNRFYLLAAMLLSVVIPFIQVPLLAENQPVVMVTILDTIPWAGLEKTTGQVMATESPVARIAGFLLFLVSIVLLIKLLSGFIGLINQYRTGSKTDMDDVSLIFTEHEAAPYSFFKWLFWRKNIDPHSVQGQRMLQHELAHIHQHHTLDKLFTEILLIVFWINPIFWLIRKELYAIHEFLADRAAIEENNSAALAEMILQTVNMHPAPLLTNPFFTSQIKRRLIMITTSKTPVFSYVRRISGLFCIALTSLMLIVTIQKTQAQTKSNLPTTYDGKKIKEIDIDRTKGTVKLTLENDEKVEKTIKQASEEKLLPEKILTGNLQGKMTKADSLKATEWVKTTMIRIETLPIEEQKPYLLAITNTGEEVVLGTQHGRSNGVNGNLMPTNGHFAITTGFKKITTGTNPQKPIYIFDGNVVKPEAIANLTEKVQEYKIEVFTEDAAEALYGSEARYGVVTITPADSKNFNSIQTEPKIGENRLTIKYGINKSDSSQEKQKE